MNRADINKLIIESKTPNTLNVKNLSKFIDKIDLEVKISNKDIVLIQAFDEERNYSESAVFIKKNRRTYSWNYNQYKTRGKRKRHFFL